MNVYDNSFSALSFWLLSGAADQADELGLSIGFSTFQHQVQL